MSKKDVERAYLERFRSLIPDFPPGRIEATEEPDFLVHQPASILGLELTDLHRDTPSGIRPQQADEAMRHRVVARAQTLYVASGNPPVRVSVFFNQHHQIQKLDVEQLARCIADLATRNLPAQGTSREQGYDWVNRAYFPEAIHKIKVHRLPEITRTFFSAPGATWVATLAPTDLERALLTKESRYPIYRNRCSEAWLVINTDIGAMSTWFEFDSSTIAMPIRTRFDRVFVLRHFQNQVYELRVQR